MKDLHRPIVCTVCQEPMFYMGDPRCEPEVSITVSLPKCQEAVEVKNLPSILGHVVLYAHEGPHLVFLVR